jgi:hypothetical protein
LDLQAAIPWTGESAWAGTAFVTTPSVRVVRLASSIVSAGDNIGVPGVTIKFTVTAGGVVRDTTVVSDEFGLGSCGSWMLGAASGQNTVTATVDGVERSIVFTAFAQARPTALASYRLDSQTPNSPYGHGGIVGGTLTLGDDGSFESGLDYYWAASESGFPVSATFWRLSTYSTSGSTIAFHDFFQSTGTVRGDSLIVTYLDEEFDPPQVIRQVYLRSK